MYIVYFLVGILFIGIVIGVIWLLGKLGTLFSKSAENGLLDFFENAVGFIILLGISLVLSFSICLLGKAIFNSLIK